LKKIVIRVIGGIIFAVGAVWMYYQLGRDSSIAILMVIIGLDIQKFGAEKLKKQL